MIFLKRQFIIFLLIISIIFNNFLFFDYYVKVESQASPPVLPTPVSPSRSTDPNSGQTPASQELTTGQSSGSGSSQPSPERTPVSPISGELNSPQPRPFSEIAEEARQQEAERKAKESEEVSCGTAWLWNWGEYLPCAFLRLIAAFVYVIAAGLNYINYIVASVVDYLSSLDPFGDNETERFKNLNMPNPVAILWSILVNISSIFLVFFALAAAFQYLFGEDALAKRNLFYILLIALLIQFSYLFVEQAFKLTFALEKGLSGGASNQIGSIIAASFWLVKPDEAFEGLASNVVNVLSNASAGDKNVSFVKWAFVQLLQNIALAFLQFIALVVLIALAILFVARYLMIVVLTGLAPLAITSIAIPQFKGALGNITAKFQFFDRWFNLLISWLLIIPVIVLGLLICTIIAKGFFLGSAPASLVGNFFSGGIIKITLGILLALGCNIGVFNIGLSLGGVVGGFAKAAGLTFGIAGVGWKVGKGVSKRLLYTERVSQKVAGFLKRTSEKIQNTTSKHLTKRGIIGTPLSKMAGYFYNLAGRVYGSADTYEKEVKKYREGLDSASKRGALVEEARNIKRELQESQKRERDIDRNINEEISKIPEYDPERAQKIEALKEEREKQKAELEQSRQKMLQNLIAIVRTAYIDPKLFQEIYSNLDRQSVDYLIQEMPKNKELLEMFSEKAASRDPEAVKAATQIFDKASKKAVLEFIASTDFEGLDTFSEVAAKDVMGKIDKGSFLQLLQKRASLQGSIDLPPQFRDIINDEGAGLYDNLQAKDRDPNKIVNSLVKIGGKAVTDLNTLFALSQQLNLQVDTIYDLLLNRIAGKEKRDFLAGAATASEEARKSLVDFLNNNPEVVERFSAQEKALVIPLGVQIPSKTKEEKMQEPTVETSTTSASTIQQEIKKLDDPNYRQTIVNSIKITVSVKDDYLQKIFSDKNELNKFIEYGNYPDINEALISLWERVESKLTDKQINIILDGIKNNLGETKVNELHDKHWVRHWFNKATEAKKKLEEEEKDKNNNQDNNPENQNSNSDNNSNQ